PVEWRAFDTLAEPLAPREGRVIVGLELPSSIDERALDRAAVHAAEHVRRGAHAIAVGDNAVLSRFASIAASQQIAVRSVQSPMLTSDELLTLIRQWTADVSAQKVCWTWSALTMAAGSFERGAAPIDRTMHNAVMLCLVSRQRIITTWHVSGAIAHGQYLLDA